MQSLFNFSAGLPPTQWEFTQPQFVRHSTLPDHGNNFHSSSRKAAPQLAERQTNHGSPISNLFYIFSACLTAHSIFFHISAGFYRQCDDKLHGPISDDTHPPQIMGNNLRLSPRKLHPNCTTISSSTCQSISQPRSGWAKI